MKKILSIILAVTMLFGIMSVVSYADDQVQHTVTITPSATTVKAGDTLSVSLYLDTTYNIFSIGYGIALDASVFSLDTAPNAYGIPNAVDSAWYMNYFMETMTQKVWGNPIMNVAPYTADGKEYTSLIFGAASQAGISEANAVANREIMKINVTVSEDAKPGTYPVFMYDATTCEQGYTLGREIKFDTVNITVEGDEPAAPTAASIGLDTVGVAKLTNQAVTNSDGSKYEVKTGLAFLSCVKTDANATDLKTVITCADREGELVIAAGDKVYVDTDDNLTYFGAAVTSIRDINLTQAFTAKAVATVGETVVTGNGATATYAE